jgi:hypothetical protein
MWAGGALTAHLRDELGLSQERMARPFQAAWASALSSRRPIVPLLAIALIGAAARVAGCVVVTTFALAFLGGLGTRLGGASAARAATRVVVWGLIAMGITAAIGALVGTIASGPRGARGPTHVDRVEQARIGAETQLRWDHGAPRNCPAKRAVARRPVATGAYSLGRS